MTSNGDDILIGQAGNDNLNGGEGYDVIIGGAGSDQIVGSTNAPADNDSDLLIAGSIARATLEDFLEMVSLWRRRDLPLQTRINFITPILLPVLAAGDGPSAMAGRAGQDLFLYVQGLSQLRDAVSIDVKMPLRR